ncbi:MAG: threonine/serine exporter family protein [Clostridia bacterium]
MTVQIVGAFAAVVTLALIFEIPWKYVVFSGVGGAVGWLVYLLLDKYVGVENLSMFAAALCVAIISHCFARLQKAPVTVFLVAGILPLVPGVGMFRIVYFLITQNMGMLSITLSSTLQAAAMIAIAIFVADTLFRVNR